MLRGNSQNFNLRSSIESDSHPSRVQKRSYRQPKKSTLPDTEQSRIYHEWIYTGKPRNIVCSECYLPENLIGCETCCRSYHARCLYTDVQFPNGNFHCPSCKEKTWDRAPPPFPAPPASTNPSRESTPHGNSSYQIARSPAESSNHDSPLNAMLPPAGVSTTSASPSERFTPVEHGSSSRDLPPISEMYPLVLAYLSQSDASNAQLTHQTEFRNQLDIMVKEVEAHRQKMAIFREEFSRVQTENMQLRTYINSQLPSRPINSGKSNFSALQVPSTSSDITGKSWDSIVSDLL